MKSKTFTLNLEILCLLLLLIVSINSFGFNYTISFTGSGASTTIDSVIVQNLTKGTTITVPADNVLNLIDVTTSADNLCISADGIRIFPNPIKDYANISFYAKKGGQTQISAYSLDGRKIIGITENILQGNNTFKLSLPKGVYFIKVQGIEFSYHAKAISESLGNYTPNITVSQGGNQNSIRAQKTKSETTTMPYSTGDQLLYKGISGNYSTIITDKPNESKTTNFEFVECSDGDGNNYTVVKIGTQTWMAENLRYLPSVVSSITGTIVTPYCYVYDYNGTSVGTAKTITNYTTYGVLYNWKAAMAAVPAGWHLPTDAEWTQMTDYLGGRLVAGGKLKEIGTTHWNSPNTGASNETGFSALPGGQRKVVNGFEYVGSYGCWWSSDKRTPGSAWVRGLNYPDSSVGSGYSENMEIGISVRCIKD